MVVEVAVIFDQFSSILFRFYAIIIAKRTGFREGGSEFGTQQCLRERWLGRVRG